VSGEGRGVGAPAGPGGPEDGPWPDRHPDAHSGPAADACPLGPVIAVYEMTAADIAAHKAASYVRRQASVPLSDEERKDLSDKVRKLNKDSSGGRR